MLKTTYAKHEHLIGTQINRWTILDIVEHRGKDKGYIYAKCQCACGTIRDIRLSKLLNSTCIDCGCGRKERHIKSMVEKYEHLVGSTINGWMILSIIPPSKSHHSTFALCKCRCGNVKEVNLSYILLGKSKDCGCGRKLMLQETRTKSLVGQRFGKLMVLDMLSERNKFGRIMYRCKCDCGNVVNVLGNNMVVGHTASCGCVNSYWNMYIRQYLDDNGIECATEYPININGRTYRFDFYLPQYNLFIEYDGEQHYMPVNFSGNMNDAEKNFDKCVANDAIKNQYCTENNINLLRIPYWESKNIETIICNHLQRLNTRDPAA